MVSRRDGDKVIVCDRENSRVQVFDFDGNFVSESSHHRAVSCAKVRTQLPNTPCWPLPERILPAKNAQASGDPCQSAFGRRRELFKPTLSALKSLLSYLQ